MTRWLFLAETNLKTWGASFDKSSMTWSKFCISLSFESVLPFEIIRLAVAGSFASSSSFYIVYSGAPLNEACISLRSPRMGAWLAAAKSIKDTGRVFPSKVFPLDVTFVGVTVTCSGYLNTCSSLKSEPSSFGWAVFLLNVSSTTFIADSY